MSETLLALKLTEQPRENELTKTTAWGLDVEDDLQTAKALLPKASGSLPERILLGKILYSLRNRGVSQRRQCDVLEIPRSRVSMLQRIGSFQA